MKVIADVAARTECFVEFCAGAGQLGEGVGMAYASARAAREIAAPDDDALGVARRVAARPVCYVEIDLAPALVIAARIRDGALPDAPLWSNLKSWDPRPWRGLVDGFIGGYPCQPFSSAGKRLGVNDPRHIWPWIARHIRFIGPRWCFFENVGEHLRVGYHEVVRPDLESLGYRVTEILLSASDVGAPHGRERLFILAVRGDGLADSGGARRAGAISGRSHAQPTGSDSVMADPDRAGCGAISPTESIGRDADRGVAGVLAYGPYGGWPPGPGDERAWRRIISERPDLAPATESVVRGGAHGVAGGMDLSRADRLHIIGNGVVPVQVAAAFTLLAAELGFDLT